MSNSIDFTKRFGDSLSQKVKLSNYSWFNLGGNAEFFFKPKNKTELLEFFKEARKNNIKTTFLGAGSNTLFRDNGVKGAVIKLGNNFSFTQLIEKDIIIPIVLWDERLSTVGSFNLSSQLDINVSKRVKNIDQNSATFILQGVLDFLSK